MNTNDPELNAMGAVWTALEALDSGQRQRVIDHTVRKFASPSAPKAGRPKAKPDHAGGLREAV
jgi:hypothetical protein